MKLAIVTRCRGEGVLKFSNISFHKEWVIFLLKRFRTKVKKFGICQLILSISFQGLSRYTELYTLLQPLSCPHTLCIREHKLSEWSMFMFCHLCRGRATHTHTKETNYRNLHAKRTWGLTQYPTCHQSTTLGEMWKTWRIWWPVSNSSRNIHREMSGTIYTTYTRPKLEYASQFGHYHFRGHIDQLEKV